MFRFAFILLLCLLIAFTGVGLTTSREWGWPEYASDELYVVYYTREWNDNLDFHMVNINGSGESKILTWNREAVTQIDCSPDGRTLAILTGTAHLHVTSSVAEMYDRAVDKSYKRLSVANNGQVTLYQDVWPESAMIMNATSEASLPGQDYQDIEVSSLGYTLWAFEPRGFQITSPDGKSAIYSRTAYGGYWLSSEQSFTFFDSSITTAFTPYLMDIRTRAIAQLDERSNYPVSVSPDGTIAVAAADMNNSDDFQVIVVDAISNHLIRQLTHGVGVSSFPLCFFTFRPQMFIAENQ